MLRAFISDKVTTRPFPLCDCAMETAI